MDKGTENFKQQIEAYLNSIAEKDSLFAKTLAKKNKNIDSCIDYILEQVKESGFTGFTDEEIFKMAIHYYDEDDIKTTKFQGGVSIVSNNHYEPTDEEIEELKEKAKKQVYEEQLRKIKKKPIAKETKAQQISMF